MCCIFNGTTSFNSLKKNKEKKEKNNNSGFFFLVLKSKEPQADITYSGPDKGSIATQIKGADNGSLGVGGGEGMRGGGGGAQWRHFNIFPVSAQH